MITARITGEGNATAQLRTFARSIDKKVGRTVQRLDQQLRRRVSSGHMPADRQQRTGLPASGVARPGTGRADIGRLRDRFRAPIGVARESVSASARSPLRAALAEMRPVIEAAVAAGLRR